MESSAPALLEVQRAVRASLLARDDRSAELHIVGDGFSPAERLDVYRNTFASVLANVLRLSFPAVDKLVGAEFFEGAARIFVRSHPPSSACLDDYGAAFPDFLSGFAPAASVPYLPDVARLEWAVNRALHAPDAPPIDSARLAALGDSPTAEVSFAPHPSVTLMRSPYPADLIWRAVLDRDDAALAAIDLDSGPIRLMVHRSESSIDVRRMSELAYCFTEELCTRRPLQALLERSWDFEPASLLADHLAAGRLVDFHASDAPDSTSARRQT
jgi:hypothetical protein